MEMPMPIPFRRAYYVRLKGIGIRTAAVGVPVAGQVNDHSPRSGCQPKAPKTLSIFFFSVSALKGLTI